LQAFHGGLSTSHLRVPHLWSQSCSALLPSIVVLQGTSLQRCSAPGCAVAFHVTCAAREALASHMEFVASPEVSVCVCWGGRGGAYVGVCGSVWLPVHICVDAHCSCAHMYELQTRWGDIVGSHPVGQLYCLDHSRVIVRKQLDWTEPETLGAVLSRACLALGRD
jgi:hypothetical protein